MMEDNNIRVMPVGKNKRANIPRIKFRLSGRMILIIGVLAIIVLTYNSFLKYVEPNEYGIKQVKIGVNRGIHEEIYGPGLHFIIPVIQKMHYLPRDIQVLELTNYAQTASDYARQENAAHIQTSDGFFVDVDVSILYHIADPYKVFTKIGPGNLFYDKGSIPKTEPSLKETLG